MTFWSSKRLMRSQLWVLNEFADSSFSKGGKICLQRLIGVLQGYEKWEIFYLHKVCTVEPEEHLNKTVRGKIL